MPHTHIDNVMHFVFSTHGRQTFIKEALRPELWAYMGGIAKKNGARPIAIGGMEDHVHIMLALPSVVPREGDAVNKGWVVEVVSRETCTRFRMAAGFRRVQRECIVGSEGDVIHSQSKGTSQEV